MRVALDRDVTDRAIVLARMFGTHGRVLIPTEDLGPKGDLNDWLRVGAKGDPGAFRSVLERALATSPTPWVLQIQRLPPDLAPWDLEDHPGVRDLLLCHSVCRTMVLKGATPGEKIKTSLRLDRLAQTTSPRERRGVRLPIGRCALSAALNRRL